MYSVKTLEEHLISYLSEGDWSQGFSPVDIPIVPVSEAVNSGSEGRN